MKIRWQRIILDEAHTIRNARTKTAQVIFKLKSRARWALTGTPVHNKELDLFSLLKFLRCKPFDDFTVSIFIKLNIVDESRYCGQLLI